MNFNAYNTQNTKYINDILLSYKNKVHCKPIYASNKYTLPKIQSQKENPEKLATQGTQDEDKQNKNTIQYVLDTTIHKQTQRK